MVRHLFATQGGHGTCFAYGQTGSGKTVTMEGMGPNSRSADNAAGMYSHVATELFECVSESARRGAALTVRRHRRARVRDIAAYACVTPPRKHA